MIPGLTETIIREHTTRQTYARGREYFEQGAVLSLARRGRAVKAEVEGKEYAPYLVRIDFDAGGVTRVSCSCAYAWRGWCKHVAAVAIACAYAAPDAAEGPTAEDLLAELDRSQLQRVLSSMVARNARLLRQIRREVERLRWDTRESALFGEEADEIRAYERKTGELIHSLDYMPSAEAYWYVRGVVDNLRNLLSEAHYRLQRHDPGGALRVLEGMISGLLEEWNVLDNSDGVVSDFWYELDVPLSEALLGTSLTTADRSYWVKTLESWANELGYYAVDDAFDRALMVAKTFTEEGAPLDQLLAREWVSPLLTEPLLQVLDRRQAHDKYLELARRMGHKTHYMLKLIELDRTPEAIAYGLEQEWSAEESLDAASTLAAAGATEAALQVAERGLAALGDKSKLAAWLRGTALSAGNHELAVRAAMVELYSTPSLTTYRQLQELAADTWPAVRAQVLTELHKRHEIGASQGVVEILLYEGLVDDAIAALGDRPDARILARVVDEAIPARPGWAIRQSLAQAMQIIEPGKAQSYPRAVEWLRRARDAHRAAGREADWNRFAKELKSSPHGRKYKLMSMLDDLL